MAGEEVAVVGEEAKVAEEVAVGEAAAAEEEGTMAAAEGIDLGVKPGKAWSTETTGEAWGSLADGGRQ